MKTELVYFDVYPKVFPAGQETTVVIKPLNKRCAFAPGEDVELWVLPLQDRAFQPPNAHPSANTRYLIKPDADGYLRVVHGYPSEQRYFLRVMKDGKKLWQFDVYAVDDDLVGRYPYMGDLHIHTMRSDGREQPAMVVANYRKIGYDFVAITDHDRYYPSLEAIDAYADAPIDMCLVPGEELDLPDGDVHIISFGGTYGITAMIEGAPDGDTPRAMRGVTPPERVSLEEYRRQVREILDTLELPDCVPSFSYASCLWAFKRIREAGGLSVFVHPYWISDTFYIPYEMTDYMLMHLECDAFEVLGGERYLDQNEFQTMHYHQALERGARVPVVGASDSHGTVNNPNVALGSTIAFSPRNEREALIESIRKGYSIAVDGISAEYRLVGDFRLGRYARFLMDNYFPLHAEMLFEEGRRMAQYACEGDQSALELLKALRGQTDRLLQKTFRFE